MVSSKKKVLRQIEKKKRRFERLSRSNRATRRASDLFLITDPKLFGETEGTFVDYSARKRINVYLVPATWTRVITMALVYAFFLTLAKYIYFSLVGKPDLRPSSTLSGDLDQ